MAREGKQGGNALAWAIIALLFGVVVLGFVTRGGEPPATVPLAENGSCPQGYERAAVAGPADAEASADRCLRQPAH